MTQGADAQASAPHFSSALIACALVFVISVGGRAFAVRIQKETIHSAAPEHFWLLVFRSSPLRRCPDSNSWALWTARMALGPFVDCGDAGHPVSSRDNRGALQQADCKEIAGWVWDKHLPNAPLSVDLHDGREYVTTIVADQYSQRLRDAGYGNGQRSFRVATPVELKDGRFHTVSLRIHGTEPGQSCNPNAVRHHARRPAPDAAT